MMQHRDSLSATNMFSKNKTSRRSLKVAGGKLIKRWQRRSVLGSKSREEMKEQLAKRVVDSFKRKQVWKTEMTVGKSIRLTQCSPVLPAIVSCTPRPSF